MLSKKSIGRLVPYPVIENGRKILNFGFHRCPVCGGHVRKMHDTGYGFEVLERLQVVGGLRRYADQCPVCHSSARERLIWFWLSQAGDQMRFGGNTTIAHFAPEKGLSKAIRSLAPAHYTAYDFEPSRYRHIKPVLKADLSDLNIAENSVDLLICNHVLEHVPDVDLALAEIKRVMRPGATAILQVPIALNLDHSIELGSQSTHSERIEQLGQFDHLRLFNQPDYLAQLRDAGFEVNLFDPFSHDGSRATQWMLDPFERLHICVKPHVG